MKQPGAPIDNVLKPLRAAQLDAVDPAEHVWLNASAGTGKTQVLAARVLRLLLDGVSPDAILCITFTKAGAAEMAHRVHERLALWVGCADHDLRTDLMAIGVDHQDTERWNRARTLFAAVIDSPAGAIRVQTIHSFCQSLLASFPFEAEVLPGFRLIEGAEADDLNRTVLAELLGEAGVEGDSRRVKIGVVSRRLGEQAAREFVSQAARYFQRRPDARFAPAAADVRAAFGLPLGDTDKWVLERLAAGAIADGDVRHLADVCRSWSAATGQKYAEVCENWLSASIMARSAMLSDLRGVILTKDGKLQANYESKLSDAADAAQDIAAAIGPLLAMPTWCELADDLAAGWSVAADFAATLAARKLAEGLAEFDDLIARTAALLSNGELADWIRFKLDQRIDHLLIDEAQDTNADQWTIAEGLTEEFFAGIGARGNGQQPSMFTVGDRKQAIFNFQGTDPEAFESARQKFAERAAAAQRPFRPLDLETNFRSGRAVLDFVDRWIENGGASDMGIGVKVPSHEPFRDAQRPARVELWPPLIIPKTSETREEEDGEDLDLSSEDSLQAATDPASLKLSLAIADQIAAWLDPAGGGLGGVEVLPQDVMVLVRNRGVALALRIVAQLQAQGVPVAGVDRFKLAAPLAVQDLLAALRFIVQPDDEYSIACLLVSPLIGWTQQQLYDETAARGRTPLRQWLASRDTPAARAAAARLELLRAGGDFETPFRLLDAILSGPLQGRRAMVARMGTEANDAIDALLAEALAYESRNIASLTGFLHHIDRAPLDIKRQTDGRSALVRVMTVHGSKGLQAPIVILADATRDPANSWVEGKVDIAGWHGLPLFKSKTPKADKLPPVCFDAVLEARKANMEEHWRLFYVAATRAERMFAITGTLSASKKGPPASSWYHAAEQTLAVMETVPADIGWPGGAATRHQDAAGNWARIPLVKDRKRGAAARNADLPDWARRSAPAEARPPRPLAPSSLGADDAVQPPAHADRQSAIQRGIWMHALIERLPALAPERRAAAAERWLRAQSPQPDANARAQMAEQACAVLAHPNWAAIFGPGSLAEAPFSAVIAGGFVIAGTVDRLLVTDDTVLVVDYKTGAHVPETAAGVAPAYLRQMAAYVAALEVIFSGRRISAALLYTAAPRLIALPDALLDRHKPGLGAG